MSVGAVGVVVAPHEEVGHADRLDAAEQAGGLGLLDRAEVDQVAGVDHDVDALLLHDRAHQVVLVAGVDVADQQHPQRGVGLQRGRLVLLLQGRRQGDQVAQVGRHLGGPGLDVAEDALVALEGAEHAGRGEGLLAVGLVRRVEREAGERGGGQPADEPGHDEGGRRAPPAEHGIPGEHGEHHGQRPEREAQHDRDRDVTDRGAQLLGAGAQRREADVGTREDLGDVGLDLRHGVDAGREPLELQAQVAERRGRHELAAVQRVRVEGDARLVVQGLRGGGCDRRRRRPRRGAGDGEPHHGEAVAHASRADAVPGPPPRADRGDERPRNREEGDHALVEAEQRCARGRARARRRQGRAGRPRAAPPGSAAPTGRRGAPRTRARRRAGRTTRWRRRCGPPRTRSGRGGAARPPRGSPRPPAASRARPARRAGTRAHAVTRWARPVTTSPVVMIQRCGVPDAASALIDSAPESKPPGWAAAAHVHPPTRASTASVALSTAVRGRPVGSLLGSLVGSGMRTTLGRVRVPPDAIGVQRTADVASRGRPPGGARCQRPADDRSAVTPVGLTRTAGGPAQRSWAGCSHRHSTAVVGARWRYVRLVLAGSGATCSSGRPSASSMATRSPWSPPERSSRGRMP